MENQFGRPSACKAAKEALRNIKSAGGRAWDALKTFLDGIEVKPNSVGSLFGAFGINEETYDKLRPLLQGVADDLKAADVSLKQFVDLIVEKLAGTFGKDGAEAIADRFIEEELYEDEWAEDYDAPLDSVGDTRGSRGNTSKPRATGGKTMKRTWENSVTEHGAMCLNLAKQRRPHLAIAEDEIPDKALLEAVLAGQTEARRLIKEGMGETEAVGEGALVVDREILEAFRNLDPDA